MIKNILKSKLFVLCSMLFCSLVVSVFCFGISSKAYTIGGVDFEYRTYVNSSDNVGYNQYLYSNYEFCYSRQVVSSTGAYAPLSIVEFNNNKYLCKFSNDAYNMNCTANILYPTGSGYSNISSPNKITQTNGNAPTYGWQIYTNSAESGIPIFNTNQEAFEYLTTPQIDWDSPFYSANIPNPNMYVSYRNLSSTPVIDVPLNVSVASFPVGQNVSEYYVQMFALVNMDFNYYVQNTRDGIVYNGLDMEKWTTYFDVVTPQDFKTASDLSEDYIHLALTNGWYNNYPQDSSFNFSFADGIPSNLQSSAITKFHNFRKNATFVDNTVYLYVRYFTIDEDNNFVVGSWTVWKSYNPNEFYAELPSYYVPYNIVPGTQGTSSIVNPVSTASPEPGIIVNPVNTNPSVNITVTQNVPNYPDYPTIASYNKDNLLVDTMNQLTSIQGFFGEFGSFLVTAFAFMPAWIWAIIGVGFSLSIVVMFLKIL